MLSIKRQINMMAKNGSCISPNYKWKCSECCIQGMICKWISNRESTMKAFAIKVQENGYDIQATIFDEML